LEVSECFADGNASASDLKAACTINGSRNSAPPYGAVYCTGLPEAYTAANNTVRWCIMLAERRSVPGTLCRASAAKERKGQASLLRDIFGDPFRPAPTLNPS
jgi:hypothetical protein